MTQLQRQNPQSGYNSESDEDILGDEDSDDELKDILESEESKLEKRLALVRKTFKLMKFKDLSQNYNDLDESIALDEKMLAIDISSKIFSQQSSIISHRNLRLCNKYTLRF